MDIINFKPIISKSLIKIIRENKVLLFNPDKPNWVVVSLPLAEIVISCDGTKSVKQIIEEVNKKCKKDISAKIKECFEKLYKLKFFEQYDAKIIEQSKILNNIYFNLTKRCNLRCVYCYTNAGKFNVEEKSLDFWKNVVEQLYKINKKASITFTGGEPSLVSYFWDLVKYAKNKNGRLILITNGNSLNVEDVIKVVDYFDSVEVSIDSLREEINKLTRGEKSLYNAKRFIDAIIEKGAKPTIMVVVTKLNKDYLYDFIDRYKDLAKIRFQPMYKMGRGVDLDSIILSASEYYDTLKRQNIGRMKDDINYKRNMKYEWCGMGRNVLSIESDGRVYPCQLLHHKDFIVGDLNKEFLENIWSNSLYRKLNVNDIEECNNCELNKLCSAPCRARAFYVLGNVYKKDPLCPDFIKRSLIDNLFSS